MGVVVLKVWRDSWDRWCHIIYVMLWYRVSDSEMWIVIVLEFIDILRVIARVVAF